MFASIKSRTSWKKGHVGSKTRSLEKPYVRSRDLCLVQILIKLGQNVCLDNFWDKYKNGSTKEIQQKRKRYSFVQRSRTGLISMKHYIAERKPIQALRIHIDRYDHVHKSCKSLL